MRFDIILSEDTIGRWAQAVNPLDWQPLENVHVQFLLDGTSLIGPQYVKTGSDGVASVPWQYPSDGSICTVNASVIADNTVGNSSFMVQPATLTVGNETELLLEAWRDPSDTGHTVYAQLVNGSGYPLQGQNVTLTVNGTAYVLPPTNQSGYVTLHLALQAGDTSANMYQIMATFNGTSPRSSSLNASDPYGDQYAVCTTTQYDLRPSTNSSTLAVLLQSTDAITAAKTPGELRDDMKGKGLLNVWTGPGDSWCTWFKIHVRIHVDWLNLTVQAWMGFPWGAGIEQCTGLENIFTNAYSGVADNAIIVTESEVIDGITTAAVAFVTGGLATTAASIIAWPAYPILLLAYVGVMAGIIMGVHYRLEQHLAKSVLLGMGGALIGFVIGLSCLDFISNWWLSASLSFAGGTAMQVAGAEATVSYFGSWAITQVACVLRLASWTNVEFNVATAVLGLMALGFAGLDG